MPMKMMRTNLIGAGVHRGGWPYVIEHMKPILHPRRGHYLFDDYIDASFRYDNPRKVHTVPWIGVWHSPPSVQPWMSDYTAEILRSPAWRKSRTTCAGILTMTEELRDHLREKLPEIPIEFIKHPTPQVGVTFTMDKLKRTKRLLQVGSCMRNTRIIYQVDIPSDWEGLFVTASHIPWVANWEALITHYWRKCRERHFFGERVKSSPRLPDGVYDLMMAESVVIMEYFAAAASNSILECIARNTPVIVNPLPGIVEYLGPDYPLYFRNPNEVPELLDFDMIESAHKYLIEMDKSWMSGEAFLNSFRNAFPNIE